MSCIIIFSTISSVLELLLLIPCSPHCFYFPKLLFFIFDCVWGVIYVFIQHMFLSISSVPKFRWLETTKNTSFVGFSSMGGDVNKE